MNIVGAHVDDAAGDVAEEGLNPAGARVRWGDLVGVDNIRTVVDNAHAKVVTWKKNFFEVPSFKCGKDFIAEATRLLKHFNTKSNMEPVAINLLVIFFPLMLQKPS